MKRLLYFLSKTDPRIINNCTTKAKYDQSSLGLFVLFTGILAFCSGSYAMKMALDADGNNFTVPAIFGLIYALIIMSFDREVVSSRSYKAVLMRIPLALMIGFVVAVPLELRIFEDRLKEQLDDQFQNKNSENAQTRLGFIRQITADERDIIRRLDIQVAEVTKWNNIADQELAGRDGRLKGPGDIYKNAKNEAEKAERQRDFIQAELEEFKKNKATQIKQINTLYKEEKPTQAADLLSMYIALQRLKKVTESNTDQAWAVRLMSWSLTLLIIFIELFPAMMKLFKEETDYDQLIHAQKELNIGIINIKTNHQLDLIEQNPHILHKPIALQTIQQQLEV